MKHFTNNCNATHLVDWKQMNCAACAEWQKLSADNMQWDLHKAEVWKRALQAAQSASNQLISASSWCIVINLQPVMKDRFLSTHTVFMQLVVQQLTSTTIHGDQDHSYSKYRQRCPLHWRQVLAQQPNSKQGCGHNLEALRTDLEGDGIQMWCSHNYQDLHPACQDQTSLLAKPMSRQEFGYAAYFTLKIWRQDLPVSMHQHSCAPTTADMLL